MRDVAYRKLPKASPPLTGLLFGKFWKKWSGSEMTYHAKLLDGISNGAGRWAYARIGVFDGETQLGEYQRNYPSYGEATFCPFQLRGKWFALYSRHYTGTRLMSLPDCKDIGGEEPHAHGFCPMEYYVPLVCVQELRADDPRPSRDASQDDFRAWIDRNPYVEKHPPWGFVGGCVWGDDSHMQVEFLDLSRADEGILIREARFGYLSLPRGVGLEDGIDIDSIDDLDSPLSEQYLAIAVPKYFTLDGKSRG